MTFGETIRHLRKRRKMSLRKVAVACDCSHVYIGEIERGVRGPFASDMLDRVCAALECNASQRAKLELLRIFTLGRLDISGLSENAVRKLIALRDELRMEEET